MFWDILAAVVIFPAVFVVWRILRTAQTMTHKTDHFDRLEIVVAGGVAMDALIKSISGTWAHDLPSVLQVCYCIACAFIAYRDQVADFPA